MPAIRNQHYLEFVKDHNVRRTVTTVCRDRYNLALWKVPLNLTELNIGKGLLERTVIPHLIPSLFAETLKPGYAF
jgi:hypothetical protein